MQSLINNIILTGSHQNTVFMSNLCKLMGQWIKISAQKYDSGINMSAVPRSFARGTKKCKKTCIERGKDKLSAKSCKVQINTDLAEYMRHRDICKLWPNAMTTLFVNDVKNEPAHTLWIPLHLLFWLCPSSGEVFYCLVVSWHGAEDQLPDGSACLLVPNITGSPTFVTFDTSDEQNLTKLGLLAEARHCCSASLRTCSHL